MLQLLSSETCYWQCLILLLKIAGLVWSVNFAPIFIDNHCLWYLMQTCFSFITQINLNLYFFILLSRQTEKTKLKQTGSKKCQIYGILIWKRRKKKKELVLPSWRRKFVVQRTMAGRRWHIWDICFCRKRRDYSFFLEMLGVDIENLESCNAWRQHRGHAILLFSASVLF